MISCVNMFFIKHHSSNTNNFINLFYAADALAIIFKFKKRYTLVLHSLYTRYTLVCELN